MVPGSVTLHVTLGSGESQDHSCRRGQWVGSCVTRIGKGLDRQAESREDARAGMRKRIGEASAMPLDRPDAGVL